MSVLSRRSAVVLGAAAIIAAPAAQVSAQEEPKADARVIARGNFEGRSNHEMRGTVSIVDVTDYEGKFVTRMIWLHDNFYLDGAPDPQIGFGHSSGDDTPYNLISVLKKKSGPQMYVDGGYDYDSIKTDTFYVWCKKFNVPLGLARLKPVKD